jgi:hypothetical protein
VIAPEPGGAGKQNGEGLGGIAERMRLVAATEVPECPHGLSNPAWCGICTPPAQTKGRARR